MISYPSSLTFVLGAHVCIHCSDGIGGDFRLSGSIIRKSRFLFMKERKTIRQKSGCLNHSN